MLEYETIVNDLETELDKAYEAFGDDQEAFWPTVDKIVLLSKKLAEANVPLSARHNVIRRLNAKGMGRKKNGYPMCFRELEIAIYKLAER